MDALLEILKWNETGYSLKFISTVDRRRGYLSVNLIDIQWGAYWKAWGR